MTLQDAIIQVLIEAREPLAGAAIADILNANKLYARRDGQPLTSSQIGARISHHPELITYNEDTHKYDIINRALHSYRITYNHLLDQFKGSRFPFSEVRLLAASAVYLSWLGVENRIEKENLQKEDFIKFFHELIEKLENRDAFVVFLNILNQLSALELWDIFSVIHTPSQSKETSNKAFATFFNSIVNEYSTSNELREGWHSTPPVISMFLSSIYKLDRAHGKIFDPFAGYGSLLADAYRNNISKQPIIVAGDTNQTAIQLAQLNLNANGYDRSYFYHKNAFNDWNNSIEADLILSTPPLNVKIPIYGLHNKFQQLDNILFDLGALFKNPSHIDSNAMSVIVSLAHLNNTGKAAIVISNSLLYSNRNDALFLRSYLVDNGWLEGVISLPANAFRPFHSAQCSVLLINKSLTSKRAVFFCNMSENSLESFDVVSKEVTDAFTSRVNIDGIAKWVSYDQLADLNFDPRRYLLEVLIGNDYKAIHQIVTSLYSGVVVGKDNLNRKEGIPFLQVGDLGDSNGLNEVTTSKANYFISDDRLLPKHLRFIPDRAVLISKIGSKLKASLYRNKGDTLCNPQIIVIKVDETLVLPEYLITQLQSDYVLEQIDAVRKGAGMPHFSQDDFQHILVKIPSINDQQIFIASFYGKKLSESESVIEKKREDDLYNIIASIKHELKQPVSSLGMDVEAFKDFIARKIKDGKPLNWNEPISELLPGETIEEAKDILLENVISRMEAAVKDAQKTLTKAEEILNIGGGVFVPETVAVKSFINKMIKPQFSNANCQINILGDEMEVTADKYQLEVLFKRLIENAIRHGFKKGSEKSANIINIRLAGKLAKRDFNEIIVENNGTPFSDGFDVNKFQKLGHTSNRHGGSGFGGFHIQRIIESHKGELHIADKNEIAESQFKVKFKIYLP
jgi:type I restriction-modification system DNA methylase subunit